MQIYLHNVNSNGIKCSWCTNHRNRIVPTKFILLCICVNTLSCSVNIFAWSCACSTIYQNESVKGRWVKIFRGFTCKYGDDINFPVSTKFVHYCSRHIVHRRLELHPRLRPATPAYRLPCQLQERQIVPYIIKCNAITSYRKKNYLQTESYYMYSIPVKKKKY